MADDTATAITVTAASPTNLPTTMSNEANSIPFHANLTINIETAPTSTIRNALSTDNSTANTTTNNSNTASPRGLGGSNTRVGTNVELLARAESLFSRWQKTFLGAIEKQSESYLLSLLKEGEELLSRGYLDVNQPIKPSTNSTILHTASWFQKRALIEWLLLHGADCNMSNTSGNSPFMLVCENADSNGETTMGIIELMLQYGADIYKEDLNGINSAVKALQKGLDLIQLKAKIDKSNAANTNKEKDAKKERKKQKLIEKQQRSAAISVYNKLVTLFNGLTRDASSQPVQEAIMTILNKNRELIEKRYLDLNGHHFLHLAGKNRKLELISLLIQCGANVNKQDEMGETALHSAVRNGDSDTVQALLASKQCNLNITTYIKRETVLDYAAQNQAIKSMLMQYKNSASTAENSTNNANSSGNNIMELRRRQSMEFLQAVKAAKKTSTNNTTANNAQNDTSTNNPNQGNNSTSTSVIGNPSANNANTTAMNRITTLATAKAIALAAASKNRAAAANANAITMENTTFDDGFSVQILTKQRGETSQSTSQNQLNQTRSRLQPYTSNTALNTINSTSNSATNSGSNTRQNSIILTNTSNMGQIQLPLPPSQQAQQRFNPKRYNSSNQNTQNLTVAAATAIQNITANQTSATSTHTNTSSTTSSTLLVQNPRNLHLDNVFDLLDTSESGVLSAAQLHDYHRSIHCCECPLYISVQAQQAVQSITKNTLLECLQFMQIQCTNQNRVREEYRYFTDHSNDNQHDNIVPLSEKQMELLFLSNSLDTNQTSYNQFITSRKSNISNSAADISQNNWFELSNQLLRAPNIRDYFS